MEATVERPECMFAIQTDIFSFTRQQYHQRLEAGPLAHGKLNSTALSALEREIRHS